MEWYPLKPILPIWMKMYEVLVIIKRIRTNVLINLATKIIIFGRLGQELQHFFISRLLEIFLPRVFQSFFAILTIIVNARTLLVIMVCIYTCESMILATKIIKIGWLGQKSQPFFISRLLEKYLPRFFYTFCYWHPYKQCQSTFRHHDMHLYMRKHDFSLKNRQNWSISGEIFQFSNCEYF